MKLKRLLQRIDRFLDRVEALIPDSTRAPDWHHVSYRWHDAALTPITHPQTCRLEDLHCIERQKSEIVRNTEQFLAGRPANHVLLWGARGTGKSTLIKSLLNEYHADGLRLIETDLDGLGRLHELATMLRDRQERFVLFCDELSFEANDPAYKTLKATLEGSIEAPPENLLIYASSNRRHLMPEMHSENQAARMVDGELHQGEAVEEKISLSERFGVWLAFHPFTQEQYLRTTEHWLKVLDGPSLEDVDVRRQALSWALRRGSRSGRVAVQFARDAAGRGSGHTG